MESKWRMAKKALGLNLCVHVPRTLDEASPSDDFSDAAASSPAVTDSSLRSAMTTGSTQLSKSGSKSFKIMERETDLHQIVNAQLSLSTQLLETHVRLLSLARQVENLSAKKPSASSKPVKKIAKQMYCGFCKKPGHLKKDCRRRLGLCLICGAAEHLLVNCPKWRPR